MSGSDDLTPNQEKALAALLVTPTVSAAADRCGLSERTVYRYLRDSDFGARYREERARLVEQAVAGLQKIGIGAVGVLRRNFDAQDQPHAQIRAATNALSLMFKGTALVDMEERLRALEEEDADGQGS